MGGGGRRASDDHPIVEESCLSSSEASTEPYSRDPLPIFQDSSTTGTFCDSVLGQEDSIDARRKIRIYKTVLLSYETCGDRFLSIEGSKSLIQRYNPGDWIEVAGGAKANDYDVPETTTLLLIGPRGSGKSSLVNSISRFLEEDEFLPDRAQVTHNLAASDGSCFLQEYMIPRNSKSFCLYDTRSLSEIPAENYKLLNRWMYSGVRHGEMVIRDSDGATTRKKITAMARQRFSSPYRRVVNYVILVVDAISVLDAMGGKDRRYIDLLIEVFSYPFLAFKENSSVR